MNKWLSLIILLYTFALPWQVSIAGAEDAYMDSEDMAFALQPAYDPNDPNDPYNPHNYNPDTNTPSSDAVTEFNGVHARVVEQILAEELAQQEAKTDVWNEIFSFFLDMIVYLIGLALVVFALWLFHFMVRRASKTFALDDFERAVGPPDKALPQSIRGQIAMACAIKVTGTIIAASILLASFVILLRA